MLQNSHDSIIFQAFQEGFIDGKNVAVDATHVEARDAANPAKKRSLKKKGSSQLSIEQTELKIEKPQEETTVPEPVKPKKRGRKRKEEREQWLLEQAEIEANKAIFEKTLEQLLPLTLDEI